MSRTGKVRLTWADGDYDFALKIDQLNELETLTSSDDAAQRVGPGHMLGQLIAGVYGNWKARWLHDIIRLGLIGGGMEPVPALRLVRRYVDVRPLSESLEPAKAILMAAIVGGDEDEPGEIEGETAPSRSPLPKSTGGAES